MRLSGFMCSGCSTLFAVSDVPSEVEYVELLLHNEFTCALCSKEQLRATLKTDGFRKVVTLGPRALWFYLNGLGLPETAADWRTVQKLLLENRTIRLDFDRSIGIDQRRCVIKQLQLDNGKVLHFAASGAGAMIYKVTEERDGRKGSELRNHTNEEGTEEHSVGGAAHSISDVAGHG